MTIKKMCLMNQTTKTLLACTQEKGKRTRTTTARCIPVGASKLFAEGGRGVAGGKSCPPLWVLI